MQNKKIIFSFAIVLIFLIFGFYFAQKYYSTKIEVVKLAEQQIKVDLAITDAEHNQGLSGRAFLKEDEGMLFIFKASGKYGFWMKDMLFPIDIIWIDADLKVVYIKKDARPELYPEVYSSDKSAKYILEVVSGFSEKNNLKVGDTVEFY